MFKFISTLLLIMGSLALRGQDIHFSQFYLSPISLNPAMTGLMDNSVRAVVIYRDQWSPILKEESFKTFAASYDQQFALGQYDYIGLGGHLWSDKAGAANFQKTKIGASISYRKYLTKINGYHHFLVAGSDFGLQYRSLNWRLLEFGNQWNGDLFEFDASISNEEDFDQRAKLLMDLSAGLLWFMQSPNAGGLYFGLAVHHLNEPDLAFGNSDNVPLYRKWVLHAGGDIPLDRRFSFLPGVVYFKQGPSDEMNLGGSLKYRVSQQGGLNAIQFGVWARVANRLGNGAMMDAIILSTRLEQQVFSFGFSYDLNTSGLAGAGAFNGALEVSVVYKMGNKANRQAVICPAF